MADDTLLADTADTTTADVDTTTTDVTTADAKVTDTTTADATTADDWRTSLAGDDEKLLGFLGRYASPKAFAEAAKKDRDAVRSKQAEKLPDNPTDDELAAYRAEHGIPASPEGYFEKLAEGLVVGDDDKPYVEMFFKEMFGAHATPGTVNAALDAYYGIVEEQVAKETAAAKTTEQASVEALREEWGAEYKRNINISNSHLATLPAEVQAIFRYGKVPTLDADGKPTGEMVPVGYTAGAMRWLAGLALEANPVATVIPGAGANQASAIAEEMATIKAKMGTDEYTKNPRMQDRYLELVEASEKIKARGG